MCSRISSWLLWRNLGPVIDKFTLGYKFPEPYWRWREETGGICPICSGFGIATLDGKDYDCICQTLMWQDQVKKALGPLRSSHGDVLGINMDMTNPKFATAVDKAFKWALSPSGTMVISGAYGCGKSHILQCIDGMLSPIALYITASDFEQRVFENIGANTLSSFIKGLSLAPVLLFDDLGMEYGSDIVYAQMVHLIDSRYRNLTMFPMALATNHDSTTLMYMDRIGSRIMQESTLTWISLASVPDYRIRRAKK